MNWLGVAAVLALGVELAIWERLTVIAHEDRVCRDCRHAASTHGHLRRGTDCSVSSCWCPQFRPVRAWDVLKAGAAAVLDTVLGWIASLGCAFIDSAEQPRCTACGGPKAATRVEHCLDCIIAGRTTP
jgi:hypothetical protein